ncbi:VOC family protein [Methanoculleus sp. FWC-SCC3]|uniref:VOC family protein n=1 Tax=Methanoculleus methanifontis TaxID=2584086 RepID=A0ABT8M575_9EURY|nr:VOC family protein [Methanoculleus sp. FWC-SCC3]MDN7013749.1 VOC family protein [Methanoculleus sp. FWC-SCC3]
MEPTEHEIYPMMLFPTLEVRDVEASVDWYTRVPWFSPVYLMQDPEGRTHLAHLRRLKHQDILLVPRNENFVAPGSGITITLAFSDEPVDKIPALDAFAERMAREGAVIEGPVDRPWSTRDVVVRDPDGYRLVFTTPDFARMRDFETTMRDVREDLDSRE